MPPTQAPAAAPAQTPADVPPVETAPDVELGGDDDELLTLDTGMLSAATQQFSSGLSAMKSSQAHTATVWNGQASELLNLPLSATIVEALTTEQIEGWGAKGNVRMLIGVLNTAPTDSTPAESATRLMAHRETALRVILGRGAKSLDALTLSLSLNQSQRIVKELDDIVQQPGDATARGGALAVLQLLADSGGAFGRTVSTLITEQRLNPIPDLSAVKMAARERGAAAAVIRVEAVLVTHEKERAELQATCQRLTGLTDSVIQGPDGPAVRIRHLPTVSSGFEDLSHTYGTRFGQSAGDNNLTDDLLRLRRVSALFDSPELRDAMNHLEDLWLTVLQERCAFVGTEASVAVALADRANFKGLPIQVAAKERLAFLGQAGADLASLEEGLYREIEACDKALVALPENSPEWQRQRHNRTAIFTCRDALRVAAEAVLQAIASYEGAIRTDEAMFRRRVVEFESLVQSVQTMVSGLLELRSHPDGQAQLAQGQTDLVAAIHAFGAMGGTYIKLGGLRMLATAMEGIAAIVESLDMARPSSAVEQRAAVAAALTRAESSGMVRPQETNAVKSLLAAVAWLADPRGAAQ